MPAVTHRFEQVERDAVFGVFARQVAVEAEGLAETGHADPDLMRGAFVPPRVMEDWIGRADRFAAQHAVGGREFAVAERREHHSQFTRRDRPGGGRHVDVFGVLSGEEADRARQQFADFLAQRKPCPHLVDHGLHALFQGLQIIGGDGDRDLHHVQRVTVVDLLQGAAAVSDALHRTAIFPAHARQMHLIGLNDAFKRVDCGVAVIGLRDVDRQRQRGVEPQQRRQRPEEVPGRRRELVAGQDRPVGTATGTADWRQMPERRLADFVAAVEQRRPRAFGDLRLER